MSSTTKEVVLNIAVLFVSDLPNKDFQKKSFASNSMTHHKERLNLPDIGLDFCLSSSEVTLNLFRNFIAIFLHR